jgi:SAM-dependent methyltransferase
MSFKKKLNAAARAELQSPFMSTVVHHRRVRQAMRRLPALHRFYEANISQFGFGVLHPFDRAHGTRTSGLTHDRAVHVPMAGPGKGRFPYAGSQPSIVRSALRVLPSLDNFAFVDLGCGKGRALLVASEFPFKEIVGVEFLPQLAEFGRSNVAVVGKRFPQRVPIRIVTGDATTFPMPAGDFVVFLYNPFGEDLISRVVSNIETAIHESTRSVFVVYYNPIYGHCFDASRSLKRFFAREFAYAPEEMGFGPFESDCVVIWQSAATTARAPLPGADEPYEVVIPGTRAKMVSAPA